jgi:hypothetical protein
MKHRKPARPDQDEGRIRLKAGSGSRDITPHLACINASRRGASYVFFSKKISPERMCAQKQREWTSIFSQFSTTT